MGLTFESVDWVKQIALPNMGSCMHAKSLQSCPTLCDPMDCSPPGYSVHGILRARILEWAAQAGLKIARRNTNNFRCADDSILMAKAKKN